MASRFRSLLTATLLVVGGLTAVSSPAVPASAAADAPRTVPALRQWTPAAGSYRFTDASRIVVDPQYAAVLEFLTK
ncbi:MAG: hypothetical protein ACJ786_08210 [Catenulispora sp.]